jgi:hypothetical protein
MSTIVKTSDPTVRQILNATFPSFTGKSVDVKVSDTVRFWGTYWDEGYRRDYKLLRLNGMKAGHISEITFHAAGASAEFCQVDHKIPDGYVVVVFVHSRGGHSIEIISPAANVTPLLNAPTPELTHEERIVLAATRSLKSSYGGVKNFRFVEARRETGISLDRWETAKASLTAKKLLDAAGAITIEGRNLVGFVQLFDLRENKALSA